MTDVVQPGTEWVLRFGMVEVPRERAELIRGLFELVAWVADHPELPVPSVTAVLYPETADFATESAFVDEVAAAVGVAPEFRASGDHYQAETRFGAVRMHALAITPERSERFDAYMSYADNVQPDAPVLDAAGEAR